MSPMMEEDDDDPFAVFGNDEEDDDEYTTTEASSSVPSSWAGRQLAEQANRRMMMAAAHKNDDNEQGHHHTAAHTNANKQCKHAHKVPVYKEQTNSVNDKLNLWPDSPPLYINGSIQLVSSVPCVGGGRGFVTNRNLRAGTLILVEEPMIEWPDAQLGKALDLVSVQHILKHDNAQNIVRDMEDFHPTKVDFDNENCDNGDESSSSSNKRIQIYEMMNTLLARYQEDARIDEYVELAKERNIKCNDENDLSRTDIVRLLLALRYNGLESGVYRHVAMFNHDCHPNCVKFMPTSGSDSEVRTTRNVSRGESLTISYLPRLVSHATRRRLLWEQHRFDIGVASLGGEWRSMECIGTSLPPSSIHALDESSVTFKIETTTSQLEDQCRDAEAAVAMDKSASNPVWNEIIALEVASLELCTESAGRLRNDNHVLLVPALRVHVDACDLAQQAPSLSKKQRILLLGRLVSSAQSLLRLQDRLLGQDHFDLARTHLEYAQAVEELLSIAPKQLVQLGLPGLSSFEACSAAEHRSRREYQRIRALYPDDIREMIRLQAKHES